MTEKYQVTPEMQEALDAIKTRVFGEDKPNIGYIKLEDGKPVILHFLDWSKKENGEFVNMWEEELEGEDGTYKVAVFRALDLTTDQQEEKTLCVSSKKLFGTIQTMLVRGFSTLEIIKHKGETKFAVTYDVIPAGGK